MDLFFDLAMHKLCKTLKNSILDFVVGIPRVCFLYKYVLMCYIIMLHKYVNIRSNS